MIVCGKCGFTQPKDVYCANCGINIETYQPVKPPAWITLIKDPYFQISSALIIALASFFIIINQPSKTNELVQEPATSVEDNEAKPDQSIAQAPAPNPSTQSKTPKKAPPQVPPPQKATALKVSSPATQNPTRENLDPNLEDTSEETVEIEETTTSVTQTNSASRATYRFYEIGRAQLENLFKSPTATVEVAVIDSESLNLQNLGATPLATAVQSWELAQAPNKVMNYMSESLDDKPPRGIRFSVKINYQAPETNNETNLSIGVKANIPRKEGPGATFDWARSFRVSAGQTALVKVKLPSFEVPVNVLEEFYNNDSPLSILSSPLFLEQKTQLLGVIKID